MPAVQFNNSGSASDRRRRRLVADMEPDVAQTNAESQVSQCEDDGGSSAFPMLSRDRLIRRIISPRLWKHVIVAIVLTFTPVLFAIVTWSSKPSLEVSATAIIKSQLDVLKGLSGLKLFAAAQFCLVIGWVRSASAVDFHGRYRWWRWMAIGLFAASFILLTDSTELFISLAARALQPIFGRIDAARPALLIVPAGAGLALILRRLIPDMGRCRLSQSLLVCATMLLIVRAFVGAQMNSSVNVFHLSTFELLISGFLLSAFQLHARYVIHVNPNPPLSAERKLPGISKRSEMARNATKVISSIEPVANDANATILSDQEDVSRRIAVNQIESAMELDRTDLASPIAVSAPSAINSAQAGNRTASHSELQGKGKSNKKQKLRNAG